MSLSSELLAALRDAGLAIESHATYHNEWFAAGEVGPFHSPEAALVAGVRWLRRIYTEARQEAEQAEEEGARLRTALAAAQTELRAERGAWPVNNPWRMDTPCNRAGAVTCGRMVA